MMTLALEKFPKPICLEGNQFNFSAYIQNIPFYGGKKVNHQPGGCPVRIQRWTLPCTNSSLLLK